jgi:hypothetical protein
LSGNLENAKSFQYKEKQAETRTCFICQKAGHIATNCPSKPRKPAQSGHKQGSKISATMSPEIKGVDTLMYTSGHCFTVPSATKMKQIRK